MCIKVVNMKYLLCVVKIKQQEMPSLCAEYAANTT